MTLVEEVAGRFAELSPPDARALLAVSGGVDSLALLDLLHLGRAIHQRELVVAHVEHGIQPGSASAMAMVQRAAADRGLAFRGIALTLPSHTSETDARRARQTALRRLADECGATTIVLAHQADDQAETVLMRVLRGSGPVGLAAMSPRRGRWIRPLLSISRERLALHLKARGLTPWEDPANADPRHLRSWLRTTVLPLLRERLPDVDARLIDAARHAALGREALDELPVMLPALDFRRDEGAISVAAPPLRGYRSAVRHAVLAALGRQLGVPLGIRRLAALDRLLSGPRQAGRVDLGRGMLAELAYGRLTFIKNGAPLPTAIDLEVGQPTVLGEARFTVETSPATASERQGWSTCLTPGRYRVRPWQRGDRIQPLGGVGSRSLAVLFREARIPPTRRPAWPVVAAEDATVVWVPGICRSGVRLPEEGTDALHVECAFA